MGNCNKPVFPDVGSMMTSPGFRIPCFSASSIILKAMRSFTLPPGLKNSHFTTENKCDLQLKITIVFSYIQWEIGCLRISQRMPNDFGMLFNRTNGVCPIAERMLGRILGRGSLKTNKDKLGNTKLSLRIVRCKTGRRTNTLTFVWGELEGSAPRCHLHPLTLSGRTNSVFISMVPLLETTFSKTPDMSCKSKIKWNSGSDKQDQQGNRQWGRMTETMAETD